MALSINSSQKTDDSSLTVLIANAGTVSTVLNTNGFSLIGIFMPEVWTAANLSFQVSRDNLTWYNLTDLTVTPIALAVTAGSAIPLDANTFAGWHLIRVVSSVAQGGDRIINFVSGPVWSNI